MSTEYDIRCLDCWNATIARAERDALDVERRGDGPGLLEVDHSGDDAEIWTWDQSELMAIAKHAKLIAALEPLAGIIDIRLDSATHRTPQIAWFMQHADHRLVVVDEYGRLYEVVVPQSTSRT